MPSYAQTSGTLSTSSGSFTPIPGLAITLPGGVDVTGLVILNLPMPYAQGSAYPGGAFAIAVDGVVSPVQASFTYNEQVPPSTGRIPTTLVVGVPLIQQPQTVQAMWAGIRGSTVIIDSPSTLSALLS
jgi:hypothetical protein